MSVENNVEFQPNIITIYRELGQIEGRVKALEDTIREIKTLLTNITSQLSIIQSSVSTALGRREGVESANTKNFDFLQLCINAVIAIAASFIIVHFGK